jgi:hypothetical protein
MQHKRTRVVFLGLGVLVEKQQLDLGRRAQTVAAVGKVSIEDEAARQARFRCAWTAKRS